MEVNVTEVLEEFTQWVINAGQGACRKATIEKQQTPPAVYLLLLKDKKLVRVALPIPPGSFDNERTLNVFLYLYLPMMIRTTREQGITVLALAGVNEATVMKRQTPSIKVPSKEEIENMIREAEEEGGGARSLVVMIETALTSKLEAFDIEEDGDELTFHHFKKEMSEYKPMTPGVYSHLLRPAINEN